ncbi:MAG: phosphate transport system regulatory protein PhoU, partial [Rikenellaceae bacterium]|nr:phosphate transport system regulatory protein PhoU [Rikenellaceae bacterium]
MKQTEIEIKALKSRLADMWSLVEQQVRKSFEAVTAFDQDLAHEIISREKSVNAQELGVDHHCENFIALFIPVAVDLRFV